MPQRFLIAADDKNQPGRVVCTFITFETETVDSETYDVKRPDFLVLQPDTPEATMLRRLLAER